MASSKKIVSLTKTGDSGNFLLRIKAIGGIATYVGIPAGSPRNRSNEIKARASKFFSSRNASKKLKAYLLRAAKNNSASNAQLLFWFTKGSMLRKQLARPVIEPAIQAPWNRREIAALIAQSAALYADGKRYQAKQKLKSAGARAARAARDWFKDPRNGWAGNSYRTEIHKGRNSPGLDTEIMRASITHVEKEVPNDPVGSTQKQGSIGGNAGGKEVSEYASKGEKTIKTPEKIAGELVQGIEET